jgi:hypothetical protein
MLSIAEYLRVMKFEYVPFPLLTGAILI